MLAGALVGNRRLGRALGRLADQDRAGLGDRLDPGSRVHEIAGDHSLAARSDGHRGLSRKHSGPRGQARVELGHGVDEVERRPDRPLRVVLVCDRGPPHRHHRVADELFHGSPVERDQALAGLEVAREEAARVFGVPPLGCRSEADEVGEQDRDEPPLRDGRLGRLRLPSRGSRCGHVAELSPAVAAETIFGRVLGAASRADSSQSGPAITAESLAGRVFRPAVRTDEHGGSLETHAAKLKPHPKVTHPGHPRGQCCDMGPPGFEPGTNGL